MLAAQVLYTEHTYRPAYAARPYIRIALLIHLSASIRGHFSMLLTYCGNIDAHIRSYVCHLYSPASPCHPQSCSLHRVLVLRISTCYLLTAQRTHTLHRTMMFKTCNRRNTRTYLHEQWKTHCRKILKSTVMGRRDLTREQGFDDRYGRLCYPHVPRLACPDARCRL